jgi:glyoxylase-like metal-dependent hydrolase (beta-lactamase superfamily II)
VIRFTLGDLRFTVLDAGPLWLDGGAMFGVVPKVLWERERPPDGRNRIRLAMNVMLVEDGARRILVDTGAGNKLDEKRQRIYGIDPRTPAEVLSPAGIAPEEIDLVVSTHLHFDHAGGHTTRDARGEVVPAFPNAAYAVQRTELEVARWENERIRASYFLEDFEPLAREGRLRLLDGDVSLTPALSVRLAPGHTPGHQAILAATGEGTVAFLSDLVPTSSHVRYPYIMAYDLEPLVSLATKKRFLPQAARERWTVVFQHDAAVPLGTIEESGGTLRVRPGAGEA